MSTRVALEDVPAAIAARGGLAFLATSAGDDGPHVAHVAVKAAGRRLTCGAGRTSRRNAAARPSVTLLVPSRDEDELSLVVDGTAEVLDDGLRVTPTSAILHRRPGGDC